MSRLGVFPIPCEFKSEDKWFRYFNRKQALVLVICGIIDYRVIMSATTKGLLIPTLILMLLFTMTAMGIVMIRLPVDALFLSGGGITIDQLLMRMLYRLLHREIYTKNYQKEEGL
ncbi:MAG: hypothetical protein PHW34_09165 [Hespellia sp.]|nr:hypothetical protein [Hespellia sp.]